MQVTTDAMPAGPRVPSAPERRAFVTLTSAYIVGVLAIVPWAGEPGVDDPRVTVVIAAAILLANLGTALLLGAWYRATGRAPLLVLAAGYLYSALMALLHAATFPGALFAQPPFGNEHTVGWLFSAWRGGVALTYLTAIALELRRARPPAAPTRRGWYLLLGLLAAGAVCALAAYGAVQIDDPSMAGSHWTEANQSLMWVWVALSALALVLVWWKRAFNDTLYLWLSLVLAATIADLVLSSLGGGRYTLGWHASRASFVVSAYLLLVYLTREWSLRQPRSPWPDLASVGGALAAACAAVHLRWFLHPWLGQSVAYITLYGAVAISVWLGGWAPATLCAALGYAMVTVLFVDPGGSVDLSQPAAALQLALYALSCAFIIGLGEGMRRANQRHRESATQLRINQQLLASELAAMERLHGLSSRLLTASDLHAALGDVLDNAMASCAADFGHIQLYQPRAGGLEIAVQRGFEDGFLEHHKVVRTHDGSASSQALAQGRRVVIEDVQRDDDFAPQRAVAAAGGFCALHCTPLRAHDGGLLGVLSMHYREPYRPTEREEQLLDLYARHACALIERLRFEQALRDADRRKDEFLATLAHELRNPLAPIRNALAILGAVGPLPDRMEKARQIMGRQVHHLVRLVDDLLDASRITLGKVQLRKERIVLSHVLREAVETMAPTIQGAGHQLHVALPEHEPLEMEADPTRIAQVVVNLLNNAAKFTDRGGTLWLTLEREDDQAVISVRDTGAGIAPAHLESVFEMFSQPAPALYRTEGGLGIGLAIVRGLVELHGGSVVAHSAGLDKGSEFVVRLPLLPRAAAPASVQDAAVASTAHARKRVLVVDDNRDLAASLRELLEMQGHDVREAHDGVEGVHLASEFKPDLVLLDIGMPRMNGYEAAVLIRRRLHDHAVRIVAITGWGHEDDKLKALDAGFDLHMTKPVDPAAVAQLLA